MNIKLFYIEMIELIDCLKIYYKMQIFVVECKFLNLFLKFDVKYIFDCYEIICILQF